jgi:hypothetical protein
LNRLKELEREIEKLRSQLGISARGETIFQAPRGMWSSQEVIVVANGCGAATLLVVEGNYPIDYHINREETFSTENAACRAAERLSWRGFPLVTHPE